MTDALKAEGATMAVDKPALPHIQVFDRLPDPPGERIIGHDRAYGADTHVEGYCGEDGVLRITRIVKSIKGGRAD
jgi:hypothetical protein